MNIIVNNIFVVCVLLVISTGCAITQRSTSNENQVMKMTWEDIVDGMPLDQVIRLLELSDAEFSTYHSEPKIRGIFRNVSGTQFAQKSVQFYLFFDSDGYLERKEVKEIFTGM